MLFDMKKLKKPEYIAAISGFFFGVLVHLFGLVNIIHNSDDISVQPTGYGTGTASGRWFLTFLGDFLKKQKLNYNLPVVNGLLFLALLAVSAGVLVAIFRIKDRQLASLLGIIFVSFPTACSTLLYRYTPHFYGLAILLAVLAVYILPKYRYWGLILSAIFTALSLGIYQAYLPLTASVFVLCLCKQVLEEELPFKTVLHRGCYACLSMILGLGIYFVCTKVSLYIADLELKSYQGINEMGQLSLREIPELLLRTYQRCLELVEKDYCNLAPSKIMRLAYGFLFVLNFVMVLSSVVLRKKKFSDMVMALLLCGILPVAVNFIEIMCPNSRIYTIMVYACVVPMIMPIVLIGQFPEYSKWKKISAKTILTILMVLILGNIYYTNTTYTSLYYTTRQTENYMASMVAQIRMTDGFDTEKEWAFIGDNSDPMIRNPWWNVPVYGGAENTDRMLEAYSWKRWITNYVGYAIPFAADEKTEAIAQTQECMDMPCWPAEGSIKVIDELVVIKFE